MCSGVEVAERLGLRALRAYVLAALIENPGAPPKRIKREVELALGKSVSTSSVRATIAQLQRMGLVYRVGWGAYVPNTLAIVCLLERGGSSGDDRV